MAVVESPKAGKGDVKRAYLRCTAVPKAADAAGPCGYETKRVAGRDMRSAEIQLAKHQLQAHARVVWVAIETERKERELK